MFVKRNVEIKARVASLDTLFQLINKLQISDRKVLHQIDIFFNCNKGRLKLRCETDHLNTNIVESTLIAYNRSDVAGPKMSSYTLVKINQSKQLQTALEQTLGIWKIVIKKRFVYINKEKGFYTRIHIDKVVRLGNFMELEVVLNEKQTLQEGQERARELMELLEIKESDLIKEAYVDLVPEDPIVSE